MFLLCWCPLPVHSCSPMYLPWVEVLEQHQDWELACLVVITAWTEWHWRQPPFSPAIARYYQTTLPRLLCPLMWSVETGPQQQQSCTLHCWLLLSVSDVMGNHLTLFSADKLCTVHSKCRLTWTFVIFICIFPYPKTPKPLKLFLNFYLFW